ncbi:T9SS type A sorting domain-containing protein [Aureivirga marina]|uniref:T9SS type A sorting domain-containing protein n=1 Tax=Aureivirga marina TaxID=1182451 RepID=UPI0018CAFC21|nr:T9SS type A sorting domain-containing protein [Aureivirga marina]
MKKITQKLLFTAFLLFSFNSIFSQCPDGDVTLFSQEQIDQFIIDYPDCTEISGDLNIFSFDTVNLNGLENINNVTNTLNIQNLYYIQNLNDLNITSVGNLIIKNTILTNFEGLNITTVTENITIEENDFLTSFDGLHLITSINGDLIIKYNESIVNFEGFELLESIGGNFYFSHNNELFNTSGLENLNTISGELFPSRNPSLVDLSFDSLEVLGSFIINNYYNYLSDNDHYNKKLANISFENLETVTNIQIRLDEDNIVGFYNTFPNLISSENINILLKNNFYSFESVFPMLVNCKSFSIYNGNLNFDISEIENITNLESLTMRGSFMFEGLNSSSLKSINISNNDLIENLNIPNSNVLTSIKIEYSDILENITINNASQLNEIIITNNPNLNICNIDCSKITELYYNYTQDDIKIWENGDNCSIENMCAQILNVESIDEEELSIYPNPTKEHIFISSSKEISKLELFDITGKIIIEKRNSYELNLESIEKGIYYLKIYREKNRISTHKIIKE